MENQSDLFGEFVGRTLEEKIVEAFDRPLLQDEEIAEVVEWALSEIPAGVINENEDYIDEVYDIIYEAIEKAIERIRR